MTWLSTLERMAAEREQAGLRRELRPRSTEDSLIDLAGNDYLGLSRHPEVLAAASFALKGYGLGATASRLVRGSTDVHRDLETELAKLLQCEAALVYSSGYLANIGAVRALAAAGTLGPPPVHVASDAHNHSSIVDGCRLAGAGRLGARTMVYAHADPAALRVALDGETKPSSRLGIQRPGILAITESIFSVNGDAAPLAKLHEVTRERGGVLLVDDAHGFGVTGPSGVGCVVQAGLAGQPDVVVTATLSKAFGAAGGLVAGPRAFIRHLVETSRTFIYDTGLPPSVAAGALAALGLVRGATGDAARRELAERAFGACVRLRAAGLEVPQPDGGIISVLARGPEHATAWASGCRARGVAVGCFRPPSTPDGSSRLRLTINAGVPRDLFERALNAIVAAH